MPCPSHPPLFDHILSNLILKIPSFWNLKSYHWAVVAKFQKILGPSYSGSSRATIHIHIKIRVLPIFLLNVT
jgi:hypothetical protein